MVKQLQSNRNYIEEKFFLGDSQYIDLWSEYDNKTKRIFVQMFKNGKADTPFEVDDEQTKQILSKISLFKH